MSDVVKKRALITIALLLLGILLALEIFKGSIFGSEQSGETLYNIVSRILGGTACMIFVYLYSAKKMLSLRHGIHGFLLFLPCMLVAVNNFPFVTYFSGEAYIDGDVTAILLYALLCLGVGFFEEMAFRGCIFTILLQRRGKRRIDVFISIVLASVIFGLVHLVNLFMGAAPGAVFLQVGYSFLIGGMCSVILVKTQSIWYCVILHAVYNFAGGVVPNCGGGIIWSTAEITLTAVVAVAVAAYVIYLLLNITPLDIDKLLDDKSKEDITETEK